MALNVQGEESLFWSAGIDLDNLSKDADKVVAQFENLKARVARLTQTFVITPDMDTQPLLAEIGQLELALAQATQLNLNTAPLYQQLDALRSRAAAANIVVPVTVDLPETPFSALEADARRYESTLAALSAKFNDISLDYRALQEQRASGALTEAQYTEAVNNLTAAASAQRTAFAELVTSQTQYDAVLSTSGALLAQKQTELQNLVAAYNRLSEAEKAAAAGSELAASIDTVQKEINSLNGAVNNTQAAFVRLGEIKAQLAQTPIDSQAFAALTAEAANLQERLLQIGRGLKIEPINTDAFDQLKARVAALSESLELSPKIDLTQAFAEIGRIQGALKQAAESGFDTTKLTAQIDELKAKLTIKPVEVPVSLVVERNDFTALEAAAKQYGTSLSALQSKLTEITDAQSQLNQQERSGLVTAEEHAQQSAALATQYNATRESITALITSEKQYNAALSAGNNAVTQKESELRTLEAEYARLSEAERSAATGQGIAASITATGTELTRLNGVISELQAGFARLAELKAQIGKTPVGTEAFTALETELQRLQERFVLLGKDIRIAPIDVAELEKLRLQIAGLSEKITINPKLDPSQVLGEIARIEAALKVATEANLDTGRLFKQLEDLRKRIPAINIPVTVDTKGATESIETLRARLNVKQQALIETTDIETVARLNKEIEELQLRITRLNNVGKSGFSNELRTELGLVEQLQKRTRDLQIRINTAGSLSEIAKLNAELQQVQAEAAKAANAGKAGFDEFGNAIKPQLGLIDELSAKLANLRSQAGAAKSPVDLAAFNAEIAATEARLRQLSQSGRAGFDEMGRPLREQEGLLQRLQREAAIYQRGIQTATLPENVAKYNQKLEQTNVQIAQLTNAGRTGFDALGNKIADTAKKTGLLQQGWNFLRTSLAIIPGLGIAGFLGAFSEAIISLISNLFKGREAFDAFTARFKTLGAALESGDYKNAVKSISELRINIDLAKQGLINKEAVLRQYNDTIGKTTGEVNSLEAAEKALAANADNYIKMTLYKAAAQQALEQAATKALQAEQERLKKQQEFLTAGDKVVGFGAGNVSAPGFVPGAQDQATAAGNAYRAAQGEKRKKEAIKQATDEKDALLNIATDFQKKAAEIAAKNKFTFLADPKGDKEAAKAAKDALREINKLLEERSRLTEQIEALRRDGVQSGMIKEASALDVVNEKYDKVIRAAQAFNAEAAKAGKANFSIDISGIEKLRAVEIRNTALRQDAEAYLKTLDTQKAAFTQYAESVKEIGIEESKAMFSEQTKGFDSYLDYLKAELNKDNLTAKIYLGIANIGEVLKFRGLVKEIGTATTEDNEQQRQRTIAAISSAQTLNARLLQIERNYQKDKAAIDKNYTGSDKAQVLANLEADKKKNIDAVKDEVFQKTELYKELSENVIRYSREQLKAQIAATEDVLANAKNLTAQQRKTLEDALKKLKIDLNLGADTSYIKNLEERKKKILENLDGDKLSTEELEKQKNELADINNLLDENSKIRKTANTLSDIANYANDAAGAFRSMADAVGPLDQKLADTLNSLATASELVGAGAELGVGIATGDPQAIIEGATKLITGFVKIFANIKKSVEETKKAIADFNAAIMTGELEINAQYRERQRMQVLINKTKLEGLADEKKLLLEQTAAVEAESKKIMAALANEQFVTNESAQKKHRTFLGALFSTTEVKEELQSLAGKTYEQLEALFAKGQLTEKAAELFQQLQKLKQEGVDIDKQLQELQQEAREAYTGTTAEAITDMILQGFANGKRAVADFADDARTTIQKALLQAFRYQALEGPIKKLYEQLAADAQSGNVLDPTEIAAFNTNFNKTIEDAIKIQEAIEQATGQKLANLAQATGGNGMAGAIKGITEETAGVIAGRLGGMQMSLVEINQHSLASLRQHEMIQNNTAQTVAEVKKQTAVMIDFFQNRGVKWA